MLFESVTMLQKLDPNLLDQYETVRTHEERISEMPRIRDYLDQRSDLPM